MPINVACKCGQKFAAKDELAGKTVKCPKCSQPLTIGAPSSPATSAKTAAPAAKPAAKPGGDPIIIALFDEVGLTASKTGVRCPSCWKDMKPGDTLCLSCGYNTETGKKLQPQAAPAPKPPGH